MGKSSQQAKRKLEQVGGDPLAGSGFEYETPTILPPTILALLTLLPNPVRLHSLRYERGRNGINSTKPARGR